MAIIFNIDEAIRNKAGFNVLQEPFKMMFENEIEAYEKNSLIPYLFNVIKLNTFQEEYRTKTTMDGFEPGADMEQAKLSDFEEGYSQVFRSTIWRNSFAISKQAIEDNQMGQITSDGVGFIQSYGRTREQFGAQAVAGALVGTFKFGKYTFNMKGMDTVDGALDSAKQVYFYNAHLSPVLAMNTDVNSPIYGGQSNKFNCYVDLSKDRSRERIASIIGQVETAMTEVKDYKGNPIPHNPSLLVIGTHYKFKNALIEALAIKQHAEVITTTDYVTKVGKWTIIATPYLNNLPGFKENDYGVIMMDTVANKRDKGINWVDRTPLEVTSRYDDDNEANFWRGRARFGCGAGDWTAAAYVSFCNPSGSGVSAVAHSMATTLNTNDVPNAKNVFVTNDADNPVITDEKE